MNEPTRKPNLVERVKDAFLDPGRDYKAAWQQSGQKDRLKRVSLFGFIAVCVVAVVFLKYAHH